MVLRGEKRTAGLAARRPDEGASGWSTLGRCGLAADLPLEALLETLDLARGVDDRLLAREERVAIGAHVDAELWSGGPHGPLGAARAAVHLGLVVGGMDIGLHGWSLLRRRPCRAIARPVVAG